MKNIQVDTVEPAASLGPPTRAPIRVLHLIRALHPGSGGPLTYLESLVSLLDPREFDTQIATLEPCWPPATVPKLAHSGKSGRDFWRIRKAFALFRWSYTAILKVDIVQVHSAFGWHVVISALLCRWRHKPFLVCPHGGLSEMFLGLQPRRKRLYLRFVGLPLLRHARALIAFSDQEARFIESLDSRLRVVRVWPAVEYSGEAARAPDGKDFVVVFVGRVAPVKNLPQLIEAIAKLHSLGVPASLLVIGGGQASYQAELERLAEHRGVREQIRFAGKLDGARKWLSMKTARVFALPSHGESFSYATAEAMALGLPVVVSDRVALAPVIRDASCGQVVPLGDVDALASALALYRDNEVWSEASMRARACAQSRFSPSGMRESLESLYRNTAGVGQTTSTTMEGR